MVVFEDEFRKSKGHPIEYKGKILRRWDKFPLENKSQKLKVVFESTNSEWCQGISLKTDKGIEVNGKLFKESIGLWENTAPKEVEIICKSKNGELEVVNVWSTGDGVIHSWLNGAAMIVEELPNGRRYKCNDAHPDDNFDDIIFRIERC
ncbi:MAG: hypothetical protein AB1422_10920 [bacterium]